MAPPRIKKAPPKIFLGGALALPRLKKRVEAWGGGMTNNQNSCRTYKTVAVRTL